MRAVDKVFQCSDMRRCILNFVITKFVPSSRVDTLRCSKVMKYYKKQLEDFTMVHPKLRYNSLRDTNVFDSNTDNYLLEFIKFSNEFEMVETNVKKKYPKVGILVTDMFFSKYGYSKNLNLIGYHIQIFLCICYPSDLYPEGIDKIDKIDKFILSEICKLNVPWASLISSDFNHRFIKSS